MIFQTIILIGTFSLISGCFIPPERNVCHGYSDPHFCLYDGGTISYQGICRYLMSGTCYREGFEPFQVFTEHENRHSSTESHIKAVEIQYAGWIIRFEKNGIICVTDPFSNTWIVPPFPISPWFTVTKPLPNHMVFETVFGLKVEYLDNHLAIVTVPEQYRNQLCGICGNFNDVNDDYVTSYALNVAGWPNQDILIGDSWQVPPGPKSNLTDKCWEDFASPNDECKDNLDAGYQICQDKLHNFFEFVGHLEGCDINEVIDAYIASCAYDVGCQPEIQNAYCDTVETIIEFMKRYCGLDMRDYLWREIFDCPCDDGSYYDPCPV